MELLERDEALAELHRQFEGSATHGRLVVVSGEAGIGKTALVSRFLAQCVPTPVVLWGGCDPLHTPRPLGPIRDAARDAGGRLATLLAEDTPREVVFESVLDALRLRPRRVLVVEDVHWADEASLDLLVWLGRRLEAMTGLILITYREDDPAAGAISRVLGHTPARSVARVPLEPLSPAAVARLAAASGRPPEQLHALTGGNPFFLTEVLAGPEGAVPMTVRDAVMARVEPLPAEARALLELVSVVPGRAETWLVEPAAGRDEALASGLLLSGADGMWFRHELARLAVETSLPAHRRIRLNESVLARLADTDADPARLAHHAVVAGDTDAVAVHSAAAGRLAAAARAHREAARHFEAALATGVATRNARAELLEAYADSAFRAFRAEDALEARRAAVRAWESLGNRSRVGENLRWQSRVASAAGLRTEAERSAHAAVEVLESLPPGHELAMAYSNLSQLFMLANEGEAAVAWGRRALDLGRRLGDDEATSHALNNVGTARAMLGEDDGPVLLRESLRLALDAGLDDHAGRAALNLAYDHMERRSYAEAADAIAVALRFAEERELLRYAQYLLAMRSWLRLEQDDWDRRGRRRPDGAAPQRAVRHLADPSAGEPRADPGPPGRRRGPRHARAGLADGGRNGGPHPARPVCGGAGRAGMDQRRWAADRRRAGRCAPAGRRSGPPVVGGRPGVVARPDGTVSRPPDGPRRPLSTRTVGKVGRGRRLVARSWLRLPGRSCGGAVRERADGALGAGDLRGGGRPCRRRSCPDTNSARREPAASPVDRDPGRWKVAA